MTRCFFSRSLAPGYGPMVLRLLAPGLQFEHTSHRLLDILLAVVVCTACCRWIDACNWVPNHSTRGSRQARWICASPTITPIWHNRAPSNGRREIGRPRVEKDLSDPIIADLGVMYRIIEQPHTRQPSSSYGTRLWPDGPAPSGPEIAMST